MARVSAKPKKEASGIFRFHPWDVRRADDHNGRMPTKQPFRLRAWRKHRGLTIEKLAEKAGMSVGNLSDLERGKVSYNQNHLEHFAELLNCTPADLIIRDPKDAEGIWNIWDELKPVERTQLVEIGKTIRKTGTGN
jgi:transcriptional regulator with XRE-family HTH domain